MDHPKVQLKRLIFLFPTMFRPRVSLVTCDNPRPRNTPVWSSSSTIHLTKLNHVFPFPGALLLQRGSSNWMALLPFYASQSLSSTIPQTKLHHEPGLHEPGTMYQWACMNLHEPGLHEPGTMYQWACMNLVCMNPELHRQNELHQTSTWTMHQSAFTNVSCVIYYLRPLSSQVVWYSKGPNGHCNNCNLRKGAPAWAKVFFRGVGIQHDLSSHQSALAPKNDKTPVISAQSPLSPSFLAT